MLVMASPHWVLSGVPMGGRIWCLTRAASLTKLEGCLCQEGNDGHEGSRAFDKTGSHLDI